MNFGPDFSGVKQPEFDLMTARHASAAERLASLAGLLYGELSRAGLDTSAASRIKAIAERAERQAADLRRRQQLARDLEKEKVVFGTRTTAGTFLVVPDKLSDAQAMLDGTRAADALKATANGEADEAALGHRLEELHKYARQADDPEFALAFLRRLGPKDLAAIPNALRRAIEHANPEERHRLNRLSDQAFRTMSSALAAGTDPKSRAYMGDDYLEQLKQVGRDEPKSGSKASGMPTGYHALAAILAAHDGKPPYSAKFMEIVGRDMIDMDRAIWSKGKNTVVRSMPSIVPGLLHAAASSRTASQTLLYHTPPGSTTTNLDYLLRERRSLWSDAPNGINEPYHAGAQSFGEALKSAMSGHDTVSIRLLAETVKILGTDIAHFFKRNDAEHLELTDKKAFNELAGLRRPLGDIFASRIDLLGQVYDKQNVLETNVGATERDRTVNNGDLDWAMLFVSSDDNAFKHIVQAQSEHMRVEIDSIFPLKDKGQRMTDPISRESYTFGHILEARRQALLAAGRGEEAALKELQEMVKSAVGMLPVPGQAAVGHIAANAFKGMKLEEFSKALVDKTFDQGTGYAFDKAGSWVSEQMKGKTLDEAYRAAKNSHDLVEQLMIQMIASATIVHGEHDGEGLTGRPFVRNGQIKPLVEMTPDEYRAFLHWAQQHSNFSGNKHVAGSGLHMGREDAGDTYRFSARGTS
ncbi:hypothetical protein [Nonomuraea sp. NPDC049309]|jgi:hypothetical protein|uniref:hypothetical protein n=1 Tax=Nonomuraea sp. NPDC049309 TaxID=3364350 RepID=UPI0037242D1C